MAIVTALCDAYKRELLMGLHSIDDDYRMALYRAEAQLSGMTTEYSSAGEVSGDGYRAGGMAIPNVRVDGETGNWFIDFDPVVWERVSVAADGCLIYNASKSNRAVAVFNFGETLLARNGKIEVEAPSSGMRGIVRLR